MMNNSDFLEKIDSGLTLLNDDPTKMSSEMLIRKAYPVIKKHRDRGVKLEAIAEFLQEMGLPINRGHLMRAIGKIEKENMPAINLKDKNETQKRNFVEIDGENYDLSLPMPIDFCEPKNMKKRVAWVKAKREGV
ncbi:MAG: hypothetical protein HOP20_08580 [Sulfuriferula sp.]|nr:hypothetical protein [Sulfuriferula sp.]